MKKSVAEMKKLLKTLKLYPKAPAGFLQRFQKRLAVYKTIECYFAEDVRRNHSKSETEEILLNASRDIVKL